MALDKAIAAGKERRRPYRGSARFDPSCRRHGIDGCPWCVGNRTVGVKRQRERADDLEREARSE